MGGKPGAAVSASVEKVTEADSARTLGVRRLARSAICVTKDGSDEEVDEDMLLDWRAKGFG